MIRIQILSGKQAGQFVLARRFPFRVGRASTADLQSTEPGVWDEHFQIDYQAGESFRLIPAGNTRTLLNGRTIESPEHLVSGAEITAGSLRVRFGLTDPQTRGLLVREAMSWVLLTVVVVLECWLVVRLTH